MSCCFRLRDGVLVERDRIKLDSIKQEGVYECLITNKLFNTTHTVSVTNLETSKPNLTDLLDTYLDDWMMVVSLVCLLIWLVAVLISCVCEHHKSVVSQ